jgi:hypothetical protein
VDNLRVEGTPIEAEFIELQSSILRSSSTKPRFRYVKLRNRLIAALKQMYSKRPVFVVLGRANAGRESTT